MSSSPHDTITAARRGDPDAWEALLREYQPMIWAVCRRILGDDHRAADAAQDAMIALVKNLGRFDGRSTLRTWVYRVATNAALDEVRRSRRRPELADDDTLTAGATVSPDDTGGVDDRLLVDEALAALPADFRAAVVLRDLADLDYAEIGDILGVPPGTVRSRIARGRRALAARLSGASGNPDGDSDRPTDGPDGSVTAEPPLP